MQLPGALPDDERGELLAAELARGRELVEAGAIVSIWRIPGGLRNVGVWEAAEPPRLHELIASLPLFRWMEAEVTALAQHPLDGPRGVMHRRTQWPRPCEMPRLTDSMEEGTILSWLKAVGDEVALGDELVEIETDKANMVFESDAAGTLVEIRRRRGRHASRSAR